MISLKHQLETQYCIAVLMEKFAFSQKMYFSSDLKEFAWKYEFYSLHFAILWQISQKSVFLFQTPSTPIFPIWKNSSVSESDQV